MGQEGSRWRGRGSRCSARPAGGTGRRGAQGQAGRRDTPASVSASTHQRQPSESRGAASFSFPNLLEVPLLSNSATDLHGEGVLGSVLLSLMEAARRAAPPSSPASSAPSPCPEPGPEPFTLSHRVSPPHPPPPAPCPGSGTPLLPSLAGHLYFPFGMWSFLSRVPLSPVLPGDLVQTPNAAPIVASSSTPPDLAQAPRSGSGPQIWLPPPRSYSTSVLQNDLGSWLKIQVRSPHLPEILIRWLRS